MSDFGEVEGQYDQILSEEERKRVLSVTRLKLTLTVFVVAILLGLSAMIFMGVSRIFDWLTPSIRLDLQHKARRGALELSETAQLGLVVREPQDIARPAADYIKDADIVAIAAFDAEGERLFAHGSADDVLETLFTKKPKAAHDFGSVYAAWAPSAIEGIEVGRIALVVSKARVEAGMELRRQIFIVAAIGCLLALVLCLVFVSMYIGPILQMTEQAFVRLETTTEAALAAVRLKSQFLANTSHEIRTPMNGIIGVLDLLNRTELSGKQHRYVQIIESSARGLLTIINDILDFAKLEAGKYELRSDDFELRQVCQEVVELLSPKAHDKGLELVARIDPSIPQTVVGDMDRLKQVLNNLVGNAIKFTEQGHVELRVTIASASATAGLVLRFAVTDTGPGISKEDQARLFAVFSQVDGSLTRKHGGTGLGLAISKQLATAMGGEVGVESEPGQGSTFWFTITTQAGHGAPAEPTKREARVLVVCPSYAQREVVRELIERWGMTCTPTEDAALAAELILARPGEFDVVVVDGAVETHGGDPSLLLDMCMGEGLPVIHMLSTAQIAQDTVPDAQRNYLLKPLRASELYNGLVNVLEGGTVQQRPRLQTHPHKRNSVAPKRPTVLVVDDNEINRIVAVDLLTELGYRSDIACNGAEAVEKAKSCAYAVILMDCQMPELDGYEATRRIRALPPPACEVPVIALTAHALAGDRDRVLSAGMDDYTTKPIRVRTLEQLLRRWENPGRELRRSLHAPPANTNAGPDAEEERASKSLEPPALDALPDVDPTLPRSKAVVELFLKSVPELMQSLAAAMEAGDSTATRTLAHKLKGNCLSLGVAKLAAAAHAIEAAAALGQLHHEAHQQLPALFAAAVRRLDPAQKTQAPGVAAGSRHG